MAQIDYFLRIDGIPGESPSDRHKEEIEVKSWGWGANQMQPNSEAPGAKIQVQELAFTMKTNKATLGLISCCLEARRVRQAILTCSRAGPRFGEEYMQVKLSDIQVSSFVMGGHAKEEEQIDKFSLAFQRIKFAYPIKSCVLTPPVTLKWSLLPEGKDGAL
jgi:type VI secretion system secreted protein Hcp